MMRDHSHMNDTIRLLYLEDNALDAELISDQLITDGLKTTITRVVNRRDFETAIGQNEFDLILCDYNLPDYDGITALMYAHTVQPNIPIIIISGSLGEEEAVKCLHMGATDYLLKHRLERLASAIQRALYESEMQVKRREAEDALRDANVHLEQALKYQELFIANMTHEIRTPLNVILGYFGLIRDVMNDRITDEERGFLLSIESASSRLMRTVDNILQITSIQTGLVHLQQKKQPIAASVRSVVHELQGCATEKEITLKEFILDESVLVVIDLYSFEQALMNLVDNAIKYTSKGEVRVVLSRNSLNACVEVHDTGIGISAEYLPKMYEAFTQEDTGYTRAYQGLGLGLALVKKYVQMNGGRISVNSRKGEGSTFRIELPLAE